MQAGQTKKRAERVEPRVLLGCLVEPFWEHLSGLRLRNPKRPWEISTDGRHFPSATAASEMAPSRLTFHDD